MTAISRLKTPDWSRGVDIAPLVVFRIIFGILGTFSAIRFVSYGWVEKLYITPAFHFHYQGFNWVNPLPGNWMYLPFIIMILGGLAIATGTFYRIFAILFFLAFSYVELLDKANYLNHYYFVSIVSFLLILVPANRKWSIDSYLRPHILSSTVPYWCIWILRFQLTLVYCFAGLAKINSDWLLEAQPLRIWLQAFRDLPVVGDYLATKWVAYVFAWFGCCYDLFVPFFLMLPKTRKPAYAAVIVFHVLTWMLFPIGVFPWVMIGCTLIFFPASFHRSLLRFLPNKLETNKKRIFKVQPALKLLLVIFIATQLIFPIRYLFKSGTLFWHEEGFRFSWRVMLIEKKGLATFYVVDRQSKGSIEINNAKYLTDTQIDQMSRQPDMILEFAHYLGKQYNDTVLDLGTVKKHLVHPRVEAEVFVTLNGRPSRKYVDRKHDLMEVSMSDNYTKWVEKEPY
jgi:hypothetical protein